VFNKKGFYTLENTDYFYTLLYHALIHKYEFSKDYKDRLLKMNPSFTKDICCSNQKSIKFLEKWLIQKEYIIERPIDLTVYFNEENLKYASKLIYKIPDKTVENNLREEIEGLKEENKNLIDELNFIKNSRTWKFTKLIRSINRRLKK
jgi:hypothetical protein